jgi:hypothetical protein
MIAHRSLVASVRRLGRRPADAVGVDVLFFRGHVWERLGANLGIVLVFVAFYFRFLHRA